MFLSHPYKFLFLIRHKDKKDLARVQFKNSGRSGVQTAESVIPPFFFLSPRPKRGQAKKRGYHHAPLQTATIAAGGC